MTNARAQRAQVAVIGAGISGLSAAWLLSQSVEVTLYEAQDRLGGHSDTFDVDGVGVDCGFIVYNERTYPNLTAMFRHLHIETAASDMSFAVSIDEGRFEYSGSGPRGLVAQKANVLKPRYWSMLKDILRFFREAPRDVGRDDLGSLDEYLSAHRYGRAFREDYLYPMAGAIWSTPAMNVGAFPAENFIRFNVNHGLLDLTGRPIWRTVMGGSRAYVAALASEIGEARVGRGAVRVTRESGGVTVQDASGETRMFDHVVIAAHADQALGMLDGPTSEERHLLGAFNYLSNQIILHTDARAMPRRRAAWASWNYLASGAGDARRVCVTYWMNNLQPLPDSPPLFLTLNAFQEIEEAHVLRRATYEHPQFDAGTSAAQKKLWSLQGIGNVWFCGAYFGFGFHEDGLQSGLAVAEAIGGERRPWSVAGENDRLCFDAAPRRASAL